MTAGSCGSSESTLAQTTITGVVYVIESGVSTGAERPQIASP
jgi:hypothetical protein